MSEGRRTTIVGRTGSGKTVAGIFHLSRLPWREKPVYIFDYKGDAQIAQIAAKPFSLTEPPNHLPGVYKARLHPRDAPLADAFMDALWRRGDAALYIDEGYMIGPFPRVSQEYRALLTQGRSLGIDVITLTQRPKNLDNYAYSEASAIQIFDLLRRDDWKTVSDHVGGIDIGDEPLKPYWSKWFDVAERRLTLLRPSRPPAEIIAPLNEGLIALQKEQSETRVRLRGNRAI